MTNISILYYTAFNAFSLKFNFCINQWESKHNNKLRNTTSITVKHEILIVASFANWTNSWKFSAREKYTQNTRKIYKKGKFKCSKISKRQNREINMQRKFHVLQYIIRIITKSYWKHQKLYHKFHQISFLNALCMKYKQT